MTTAETVLHPQLTSAAHKAALWTVSEADREFQAHLPLDDFSTTIHRPVAEKPGSVVDQAYLNDLRTIHGSMQPQYWYQRGIARIQSYRDTVGLTAREAIMTASLYGVATEKRDQINDCIQRVGNVYLRITDYETHAQERAAWVIYLEARGPNRAEVSEDIAKHPGQRVGRLTTCLELDDDSYYRFLVEGKGGDEYVLSGNDSLVQVVVESGRIVLNAPETPEVI